MKFITRILAAFFVFAIPVTANANGWRTDPNRVNDGVYYETIWFNYGGMVFEASCFPDKLEIWMKFEGRDFSKAATKGGGGFAADVSVIEIESRFGELSPTQLAWVLVEKDLVALIMENADEKNFVENLLTSDTMHIKPPEDAVSNRVYSIPLDFESGGRGIGKLRSFFLHSPGFSCDDIPNLQPVLQSVLAHPKSLWKYKSKTDAMTDETSSDATLYEAAHVIDGVGSQSKLVVVCNLARKLKLLAAFGGQPGYAEGGSHEILTRFDKNPPFQMKWQAVGGRQFLIHVDSAREENFIKNLRKNETLQLKPPQQDKVYMLHTSLSLTMKSDGNLHEYTRNYTSTKPLDRVIRDCGRDDLID